MCACYVAIFVRPCVRCRHACERCTSSVVCVLCRINTSIVEIPQWKVQLA
jgi:hypothetical protein